MNGMNGSLRAPAAILGITLAIGLATAGWFVANAVYEARSAQRVVTVRGLAERTVPADTAIWPIVFTVTGDDLSQTQGQVEAHYRTIRTYLEARGFSPDEMSTIVPRITDVQAQMHGQPGQPASRYIAEAALTLRTPRVNEMRAAMQGSGELVSAGIVLVRSWEHQPQYLFTELDAIKPEMIAAATRDARSAAQQFAADSGSRVGSIRTAQQGYFSINDRDAFSPEFKTVRVVTTVEYFLVD
jgi:uncharacterized protein